MIAPDFNEQSEGRYYPVLLPDGRTVQVWLEVPKPVFYGAVLG